MTSTNDLRSMFQDAASKGIISPQSLQTLNATDLGQRIRNALGVSALNISSSEVFLTAQLVDDSGSIRMAGQTQTVRDGHNLVIDTLRKSKSADDIMAHAAALNRGMIYPFVRLADAPDLDQTNYDTAGATPLNPRSIEMLATVLAKEREFAAQGVPARTATLIVTDGENTDFSKSTSQVKDIVDDMRRRETHIVAAMGIANGRTDFRRVFDEMGIDPKWILLPTSDPSSIRRCFEVFSKSSLAASQGAAAFSKTLAGGFGGTP